MGRQFKQEYCYECGRESDRCRVISGHSDKDGKTWLCPECYDYIYHSYEMIEEKDNDEQVRREN